MASERQRARQRTPAYRAKRVERDHRYNVSRKGRARQVRYRERHRADVLIADIRYRARVRPGLLAYLREQMTW